MSKSTKVSISSIIDLAQGKLSPEESLKVLEQLEQNPEASKHLDIVNVVMNFAELRGQEVFGCLGQRKTFETPALRRLVDFIGGRRLSGGVALPVGFAVVVLVLSLILASDLSTGKYYKLAKFDAVIMEADVRGQVDEELTAARRSFLAGEYEESIKILERYIRAYPKSDLIDYAHYCAAATYLTSSHRSYLSLFPSYDNGKLTNAIEHLRISVELTSNIRLEEESHWLLAKAFLAQANPRHALAELRTVVALNGPKRDDAHRLITSIESK